MNYLKKLGISILLWLTSIMIFILLFTTLSYFEIIKGIGITTFKIGIPILAIFISSFYLGKKANKKGWLEGIKLGLIVILFIMIMSFIILKEKFKITYFIYYIILLTSSILGGMIGINFNKKRDSK
jgi:putative membrane protein (TIGR04086 family)